MMHKMLGNSLHYGDYKSASKHLKNRSPGGRFGD